MTRIVMDDVLRQKLNGLNEILELCDDSGQILARVVPTSRVRLEDLIPPISEEELRRRLNTPPSRTYTTEEVLRHLESL